MKTNIKIITIVTVLALLIFSFLLIQSAKTEKQPLAYTGYASTADEVEETVDQSELLPPDTSPGVL